MDTGSAKELLETVTSLVGVGKAIAEASKALGGRTKAHADVQRLVVDFQTGLLGLQAQLLGLQQELASAREENHQLKQALLKRDAEALTREEFERKKIGSCWVMVPRGKTEPYLCPTCYDAGKNSYLTPLPGSFRRLGTHICPTCNAHFATR